jgi:hypothetical protein
MNQGPRWVLLMKKRGVKSSVTVPFSTFKPKENALKQYKEGFKALAL